MNRTSVPVFSMRFPDCFPWTAVARHRPSSPTSPSIEMPKSKRNRPVTLSKTKKKGREHKEAVAAAIKQVLDSYTSAYAFNFKNMCNQRFKEFREQHKSSSRFFLGSNKVMQISLGSSVGDEAKPGIYKLSKFLRGNAGLMFTNLSKEEVLKYSFLLVRHGYACWYSLVEKMI